MLPVFPRRSHPSTVEALLATTLGIAVVSAGVSLWPTAPERDPCHGGGPAVVTGRGGSCALHCMWSARVCRMCCAARLPPEEHATRKEDQATVEPDSTTKEAATDEGEPVTKDTDGPKLVFPNQLPDGTQEAMLETAAHILAIVSREDSVRIRIWVESPERNLDNIDRLAGKLASFPRAPFGRAYWRLVLRASKDRPFTLLREALAVRAAYLEGSQPAASTAAPDSSTDAEQEATERWRWRLLLQDRPALTSSSSTR